MARKPLALFALLALLAAGCRLPDRPTRAAVHVTVHASPLGTRVTVDADCEIR